MAGPGGLIGGSGQGVGGGTGLHPFDTGLNRPQRTLVRQHVIAQLAPLLKSSGGKGYVNRVTALPRPLRNLSKEDLAEVVNELEGQVPSILVALGGKTYERVGERGTEVVALLEVEIYALSSHQRSFIAGRLEQDAIATGAVSADPGVETMLEHIEERLIGQTVGPATTWEFIPRTEDEVATSPDLTMWSQSYVVHLTRDINVDRDVADVVTTVEVKGTPDGLPVSNAPLTDTVTELEVPAP